MNTIGNKTRILRETKGLSQDNIAIELGLTQPSYGKLEKNDDRISITRLIHISKILKTSVSDLIDEKTQKVINQQNSENPSAYVDSVINADKDHINSLKDEIIFLRNLLNKFKEK